MKNEDTLKEAFENVKKDIFKVQSNVESLNLFCLENQSNISSLSLFLKELQLQNKELLMNYQSFLFKLNSFENSFLEIEKKLKLIFSKIESFAGFPSEKEVIRPFSTTSTDNSTGNGGVSTTSTDNSTDKPSLKPLETKIPNNSTGNEGVSTDRQTDRQTGRHSKESSYNQRDVEDAVNKGPILTKFVHNLNSIEEIKQDLKNQFENLTPQEFLVFSTIYQFSLENDSTTYSSLAQKLNLTQSSIRDYVQRLILKGIPIEKQRKSNRNISLFITKEFQEIVSLPSILRLRNL